MWDNCRHKCFRNNTLLSCFVTLLFVAPAAESQTTCATQNAGNGVFICYPNPSANAAEATVPNLFHLSAQGSAPDGQVVAGYRVLIDNRLIYEKKLLAPVQRLSIETNLRSPLDSGSHTLQLVVRGAGTAEVKDLRFTPSKDVSFCDPFTRTDPRNCTMSTVRRPLEWSPRETTARASSADAFDDYSAYSKLYGQNLKTVEADSADAMTLDAEGNLYVASHAFADVDLRKYAPNGSLIYAALIRSCGDGFLAVSGLAIDPAGRLWIAGNTNACLTTTPNAMQAHVASSGPRPTTGFLILVDTKKPSSSAPLYVSYLPAMESRITGIRADDAGHAYITGTVVSGEFPHESLLKVSESSTPSPGGPLSFVAAVDPSGSGFQWSTLLENAQLNDLALDRTGDIFITGRAPCGVPTKAGAACDDVLVAKLVDRGRQFTYLARFGGSTEDEGRAIAATGNGAWVFVGGVTARLALQPCKTGIVHARGMGEIEGAANPPEIAMAPALQAFTAAWSGALLAGQPAAASKGLRTSIQIAPECASGIR